MSILSPPPQIFMRISFKDLELLDSLQFSKKDILCAVFLNENLIDKLSLDQHSSANLFFTSPDAKIRLIFRTKQTASVLGSISFLAQNLFSFNGKSFSQWLTLFDSADDDEFDGNVGLDDEEKSRALIHYKINNSPIADSTVNLTSMEDVNITTDVKEDMSIASSLPSLFYNITSVTDRESEIDKAKIQKFEEINCYPNLEAISQVPVPDSAYSSIAAQEIIQPAEETTFTIEEEKPRNLKQIREESEVLNTENSVVKTDTTEIIENKVYEVLNAMKNKGIFSNLDQSREFDANKYLLQQEFERNVKLQEALKGTEEKLLQSEKAYMELDKRTRTHIQGILDKNSGIVQENQALRDQIGELEMSYKKIIEEKDKQLQDSLEQNKRSSQFLEEYKTKQEEIAEELKNEIARIKAQYHKEKEISQGLQEDIEKLAKKAQQDLDSAKQVIKEYIGQANKASEDLNENIKINGDKMIEVEKLKTVKKSLEGELALKEGVIEGMKREIEGYQRVIQELREAVSRFGSQNEIEVTGLKKKIQELEENLRKENSENQEILLKKQELENEVIGFKAKGYEDIILRLEGELERSEKTNCEMKELASRLQEASQVKSGEINSEVEKERERLKEQIDVLMKEQEDKAKNMQNLTRENVGLRRRLEELEITNSQYEQNMEKFKHISQENQELRENLGSLREKLSQTMADLVKQTGLVLSQKATIKEKNEKIQILESNLQDAFADIQKFHLRLEAKNAKEAKDAREAMEVRLKEEARETRKALEAKLAQEAKDAREAMEAELEEMYLEVKKTIEGQVAAAKEKEVLPKAKEQQKGVVDIDHRLKELMNRSRIPMKFIRIGEGLYVFGSKRVHVKGINGKLAIRIGGGYMYIEEFIRLYAQQELAKLKTMKGDISYSNIEDEDLPDDVETSQIVSDTSLDEHYALRELGRIKGNDIRRIPEIHTETPKKRTKSRMSHRSPAPENLHASSVTFRLGETSGNKHRDSQELTSYDSIWKETTRASSPNTSALNRTSKTPKKRMNGSMEFLSPGSLKRVSDEGYRTTPVRNSEGKSGILAKRRNYGRA